MLVFLSVRLSCAGYTPEQKELNCYFLREFARKKTSPRQPFLEGVPGALLESPESKIAG